jgi:adenine/guanine phosphoribosyltransferase-like PRPP-binding protein
MMRKLLLALVVGISLFAGNCFAEGETHAQIIYTEVINNTGAASICTAIPVDKIRPDVDKILGVEVMALSPATVVAALWDATSTAIVTATEMICEYEATSYYAGGAFFPFPRYVVNGVVVNQDAQSRVIIYYVRQ